MAEYMILFHYLDGAEKKAVNGCNQISEKAGSEKPSGDSKRPAERLGGNRHWGFSTVRCVKNACQNFKTYTTTDPKAQEKSALIAHNH